MRLRQTAMTGVLVILGCGSSPTPPPGHNNPARPSGTILFTRCPQPGGPAIYEMQPDGSNVTLLVTDASDPGPSPDGRLLTYERDTGTPGAFARDLFVADARGRNERRLTYGANVYQQCWSPSGTWIVTNTGLGGSNSWPTWLLLSVANASVDTLFEHLDGEIDVERNPWSADEAQLLFHENIPNTNTAKIYTLTIASRSRRLVLEDGWGAFFGATDDRIYFNRSGNTLWSATIAGTDIHRCFDIPSGMRLSDDHSKVVLIDYPGCELFLASLATCATSLLFHGTCSSGIYGQWAPDGRFLLIQAGAPTGPFVLDSQTGQTLPFTMPTNLCGGDFFWRR